MNQKDLWANPCALRHSAIQCCPIRCNNINGDGDEDDQEEVEDKVDDGYEEEEEVEEDKMRMT